jgi:hypothetical protein
MLLDIEAAVFAGEDHVPVIRLLDMVAEGRHDWLPSLPDALRADRFVARLTEADLRVPALAELVRKSVEEAANPRPRVHWPVRVTVDDLRSLVEDLGREAVVVVEDSISDECFLLATAVAFGHHHIVYAQKRRWLRFVHAGGKSRMDRFVAKERESFAILIRVAALLDSDRKVPAQRSPNHDQLTKIQSVDGVTEVHMWEWCEVENYVPTRVWDEHFPRKSDEIERIRAMPPEQRGVLDIKHAIGDVRRGRRPQMPSPLIPDHVTLTEDDFAELGPDAVDELKSLLAMIQRIL